MIDVLIMISSCCAATALGVGIVRRYAISRALLDQPGPRGSHSVPTPRGGGLALVLVVLAGLVLLAAGGRVDTRFALTMSIGGGAVALIGFVDDHGHVAARWRLLVHLGASCCAVALLGAVTVLEFPARQIQIGWFGVPVSLLAGVWLINLFNFMDGIDGIAGLELVTVAAGIAALAGPDAGIFVPACMLSASGVGFLFWNRPPARIFMGDVGSGFLGFAIAVLILAGIGEGSLALWAGVMLPGVFIVDATVTLLVRAVHGERLTEAHGTHAFQHLARRFGHGPVTCATGCLTVFWLLPLAGFAQQWPEFGVLLLVLAWAPLVYAALLHGAGRAEVAS